jgi:hypothetical protein
MDHHKALLAFFLVARRLLSLSEFLSSRARPIEESRPRTRSNAESLTPSFCARRASLKDRKRRPEGGEWEP